LRFEPVGLVATGPSVSTPFTSVIVVEVFPLVPDINRIVLSADNNLIEFG